MIMTTTKPHKCNKCGHKWSGRKPTRPQECPACKSRNWHKKV